MNQMDEGEVSQDSTSDVEEIGPMSLDAKAMEMLLLEHFLLQRTLASERREYAAAASNLEQAMAKVRALIPGRRLPEAMIDQLQGLTLDSGALNIKPVLMYVRPPVIYDPRISKIQKLEKEIEEINSDLLRMSTERSNLQYDAGQAEISISYIRQEGKALKRRCEELDGHSGRISELEKASGFWESRSAEHATSISKALSSLDRLQLAEELEDYRETIKDILENARSKFAEVTQFSTER